MNTTTNPLQLGAEITLKQRYSVRMTVKGAQTLEGMLERLSGRTATLSLRGDLTQGQRCYVRFDADGNELYSRAMVLSSEAGNVMVWLENGVSIFEKIARLDALAESSSLKRLQMAQTVQRILEVPAGTPKNSHSSRRNCWEVNQCGKEHYCAAGISTQFDGYLGGRNGGRFCAFIDETLCKDGRPLAGEKKLKKCAECLFFQELLREATTDFATDPALIAFG
ncbi:MAG: hypothetical protein HQL76_08775 [Magnetococcales bacterium]|nr:hypothetical protein [Magnetococcales bacterium]